MFSSSGNCRGRQVSQRFFNVTQDASGFPLLKGLNWFTGVMWTDEIKFDNLHVTTGIKLYIIL